MEAATADEIINLSGENVAKIPPELIPDLHTEKVVAFQPRAKLHSCSFCGKPFASLKCLRKHELNHFMTVDCEFCGAQFKRKSVLVEHLRTHTGWHWKHW